MSYLNTENEFFIPAVAPAFFNAFSIAVPIALFGYFLNRGKDPILGMAIGVTIGGLAQFLVHIRGSSGGDSPTGASSISATPRFAKRCSCSCPWPSAFPPRESTCSSTPC